MLRGTNAIYSNETKPEIAFSPNLCMHTKVASAVEIAILYLEFQELKSTLNL